MQERKICIYTYYGFIYTPYKNTQTYVHVHNHTLVHINTHTRTLAHKHNSPTCTHIQTHTYVHTYTQVHTHIICSLVYAVIHCLNWYMYIYIVICTYTCTNLNSESLHTQVRKLYIHTYCNFNIIIPFKLKIW